MTRWTASRRSLNLSSEPPLARLTAIFAVMIAMAACNNTPTARMPESAPAPAAAPAPSPQPAPQDEPDPLEALPAAVLATREDLLVGARAGDWDALGDLIPTDTLFTSNFDGETDHLAVYRDNEPDLLAEVEALLVGPFVTLDDTTVWPELYARVPFAFGADEREDLAQRYGADRLAEWEQAGAYLGWRLGITAAGEWIFLVAGD